MDGSVNFVAENAMKILVNVLTLIAIRWIYNHESHDSLEKEGVIMRIFPLDLTTKTDELKKLIAENPDLPIVVLAKENIYI